MSLCEQQRRQEFVAFCEQHFLGAAVDVLWEQGYQYPYDLTLLRDCAGAGGETCSCDLHLLHRGGMQTFPMRRVRDFLYAQKVRQINGIPFVGSGQASQGAGGAGAGGAAGAANALDGTDSRRKKEFEAYCEQKSLGSAVEVLWKKGVQYSRDLTWLKDCAGSGTSETCKCDFHGLERGGMKPFPMRLLRDYLAAHKKPGRKRVIGEMSACASLPEANGGSLVQGIGGSLSEDSAPLSLPSDNAQAGTSVQAFGGGSSSLMVAQGMGGGSSLIMSGTLSEAGSSLQAIGGGSSSLIAEQGVSCGSSSLSASQSDLPDRGEGAASASFHFQGIAMITWS